MYAYKDFYEGKAHIPTPGDYKPYRYVSPQRIRFLLCCGLKLGTGFAPFGLELVWFLRKVREYVNVFVVSIPNEKWEKKINK